MPAKPGLLVDELAPLRGRLFDSPVGLPLGGFGRAELVGHVMPALPRCSPCRDARPAVNGQGYRTDAR